MSCPRLTSRAEGTTPLRGGRPGRPTGPHLRRVRSGGGEASRPAAPGGDDPPGVARRLLTRRFRGESAWFRSVVLLLRAMPRPPRRTSASRKITSLSIIEVAEAAEGRHAGADRRQGEPDERERFLSRLPRHAAQPPEPPTSTTHPGRRRSTRQGHRAGHGQVGPGRIDQKQQGENAEHQRRHQCHPRPADERPLRPDRRPRLATNTRAMAGGAAMNSTHQVMACQRPKSNTSSCTIVATRVGTTVRRRRRTGCAPRSTWWSAPTRTAPPSPR